MLEMMRVAGADVTIPLPSYETSGAAGADVRASFPDHGNVVLAPGARMLVPTGLIMAVPQGFEVQMRPRSGLALKHGLTLVNVVVLWPRLQASRLSLGLGVLNAVEAVIALALAWWYLNRKDVRRLFRDRG